MQLFWEEDHNGAVEKWLHIGAVVVNRVTKSLKEFKGFTDRATSEWVRVPVGSIDGKTIYNYLMFLPVAVRGKISIFGSLNIIVSKAEVFGSKYKTSFLLPISVVADLPI